MSSKVFPDAYEDEPVVSLAQFPDEVCPLPRPTLATRVVSVVGDRLYVNVAIFNQTPEWVATRIVKVAASVTRVACEDG